MQNVLLYYKYYLDFDPKTFHHSIKTGQCHWKCKSKVQVNCVSVNFNKSKSPLWCFCCQFCTSTEEVTLTCTATALRQHLRLIVASQGLAAMLLCFWDCHSHRLFCPQPVSMPLLFKDTSITKLLWKPCTTYKKIPTFCLTDSCCCRHLDTVFPQHTKQFNKPCITTRHYPFTTLVTSVIWQLNWVTNFHICN